MLRWLGPGKAPELKDGDAVDGKTPAITIPSVQNANGGDVTDDPLAVLDSSRLGPKQIYSVSRSVFLPRVTLSNKGTLNTDSSVSGDGGVNPLFKEASEALKPTNAPIRERSNSSGYGGSHGGSSLDQLYLEHSKLREDAIAVLEKNPNFVKSIKVATKATRNRPSSGSGSSGNGTLTTIPEGRVDLIPKPIWPKYDSIVDEALLLYTSLNRNPEIDGSDPGLDLSVREILTELLNNINAAMEAGEQSPEETLRKVNERIAASIELLKVCTEEEMRRLCVNLSNCKKINSVLKAFGSSSGNSSGNSSRSSPGTSETEDSYQTSSSSGFSETRPVLTNFKKCKDCCLLPKKNSLRARDDEKPSVWEQYYGVKASEVEVKQNGTSKSAVKPTDVPLFPGGRPEADFTLDVPRSELLSKRMKEDKKWRCRCRLLTSFLGLVFFLLSVMAVSLMLTRGKRMFGSMM